LHAGAKQQVPETRPARAQAQALMLTYRRWSQIANECRVDPFRARPADYADGGFESDDDAFADNDEA
jgi:hypothetical protein